MMDIVGEVDGYTSRFKFSLKGRTIVDRRDVAQ
jgi:hypothetical protein